MRGAHVFPAGLWQEGWKPGRGNDRRQTFHPSLVLQMTSLRFRKKKELGRQQPASLLAYLQEHRPSQSCHPGCSPASLSLLCCWLPRRCAAGPHPMHPVASFFYADSLPWLPSSPGIPVWAQRPEKLHLKMCFPFPHTHPLGSCPFLSTSYQQSASPPTSPPPNTQPLNHLHSFF